MTTNRLLGAIAIVAAVLAVPTLVQAADVFVIANNALTLAPDEIKEVFLGEKQVASGTKVVPLDNVALQKDFLDKVIKLDAAKYGAVWTKKGFRDGLTAPVIKNSDAEVIAAVKASPGGVGYVSSAAAATGVKVIQKF